MHAMDCRYVTPVSLLRVVGQKQPSKLIHGCIETDFLVLGLLYERFGEAILCCCALSAFVRQLSRVLLRTTKGDEDIQCQIPFLHRDQVQQTENARCPVLQPRPFVLVQTQSFLRKRLPAWVLVAMHK